MSKFCETNIWLAFWWLNIISDKLCDCLKNFDRLFTKIIVKHLHFLHRENETKLNVRKFFFSAQTKGALRLSLHFCDSNHCQLLKFYPCARNTRPEFVPSVLRDVTLLVARLTQLPLFSSSVWAGVYSLSNGLQTLDHAQDVSLGRCCRYVCARAISVAGTCVDALVMQQVRAWMRYCCSRYVRWCASAAAGARSMT